jgi:hypothetical protein
MKSTWARVLVISMMLGGTMVLSALTISTNVSAASVDGTWVSRVSGEGYSQTYLGMSGGMITEYLDVTLELTQAGDVVTGTLTSDENGYRQTFNVEGTVDGGTFYMTAHYGWDGVSYLNPTYTMTIDGSTMTGTGSYYNVGTLVTGTFDLKKDGFFSVGGIAPAVSGAVIALGIISIVVAASAGKAPGRKGFQPGQTSVPSPPSPYQPSQQWTTDPGVQPITGESATPLGGAGLQYATPAPVARPAPPKVHYTTVSQNPPRCPVHGDTALIPHFSPTDMNHPGYWYCPKCKGYPWGKN